jgi:hypothetical protein
MSNSSKRETETAQPTPVKLVIRKLEKLETTFKSTTAGT